MPNIQYFLGGNTPTGFYSLYHQLSDPVHMRALYIIKGGPGSGKSTLMRRVERHIQAAGLETEQVLCSGDPDSLDGLLLPELGVALVDGTAPQGVVPKGHFGGQYQNRTRQPGPCHRALRWTAAAASQSAWLRTAPPGWRELSRAF